MSTYCHYWKLQYEADSLDPSAQVCKAEAFDAKHPLAKGDLDFSPLLISSVKKENCSPVLVYIDYQIKLNSRLQFQKTLNESNIINYFLYFAKEILPLLSSVSQCDCFIGRLIFLENKNNKTIIPFQCYNFQILFQSLNTEWLKIDANPENAIKLDASSSFASSDSQKPSTEIARIVSPLKI